MSPLVPADRLLLDSGVYDPLLDRPDVVDALLQLIATGRASLLVTHIQRQQVPRGSAGNSEHHAQRRALFQRLLEVSEEVRTGVLLLGITPWGEGSWVRDAEAFDRHLRTERVHLKARTGVVCDTHYTDDRPRWTRHLDQVSCAECRDLLGIPVTDLLRYRDSADAALIETAGVEGGVFVTRESTGRAPAAADRHEVPRMTVEEFFAWVLRQS